MLDRVSLFVENLIATTKRYKRLDPMKMRVEQVSSRELSFENSALYRLILESLKSVGSRRCDFQASPRGGVIPKTYNDTWMAEVRSRSLSHTLESLGLSGREALRRAYGHIHVADTLEKLSFCFSADNKEASKDDQAWLK